ncbi:MAG TPA: hypothetical protein VGH88_23565 [Streptosporangiaceae bacterium]
MIAGELTAGGLTRRFALRRPGERDSELPLVLVLHGHDAVVHVLPDQQPEAAAIVVRTLGGCDLPAGSPVTLHARGPVLAWNQ